MGSDGGHAFAMVQKWTSEPFDVLSSWLAFLCLQAASGVGEQCCYAWCASTELSHGQSALRLRLT